MWLLKKGGQTDTETGGDVSGSVLAKELGAVKESKLRSAGRLSRSLSHPRPCLASDSGQEPRSRPAQDEGIDTTVPPRALCQPLVIHSSEPAEAQVGSCI